jgi:hypothetical protein
MIKWEYKVVDVVLDLGVSAERKPYIEQVETILNDLGREGWEVIRLQPPIAYLRRPINV